MTLSVWGTSTFLLLIYETRCSEASFLVKRGPLCRSSEYLCSSQFYRERRTFIRGIRSRLALKKCNWKTLPWLRGRNWWSSSDCISQCTVFSLTTFCSRTMDSYPDCWVALTLFSCKVMDWSKQMLTNWISKRLSVSQKSFLAETR